MSMNLPFDLQPMMDKFVAFAPNLIGALAILIIGWIVALIIAALVRVALKRTTLDDRIAAWIAGDDSKPLDLERGVSKAIFYLVMVFVLLAFFQALQLTIITEPLNVLLSQVAQYIPQLSGAAILLLIAWLIAMLLRTLVAKGLLAAKLDERLRELDERAQAGPPLSKTLSEAAYWLVFLLFLPAVLDALALQGLLDPVQGMVDKLLGFLPNLLAAGVILAVGWFIATILRRIVTSILAALGADRLGQRVGADLKISDSLGTIVYILVFLPVAIAALNTLQLEALTRPVSEMLGLILSFLPNLMAATIILAIGWFIARILQRFIAGLLESVGVDQLSARVGLKLRFSSLLGTVVYALVLIPVLIAALDALQLGAVTRPATNMLDMIMGALPAVFTGVAILAISFVLGRVVAGVVSSLLAGAGFDSILVWLGLSQTPAEGSNKPSDVLGSLAMAGIMLFASMEVFNLLGFDSLVGLANTFTLLAGRVLLGLIILAVGLYLANLAAAAVRQVGSAQSNLLSVAARACILVLAGAIALRQMGLANDIINLAFGLLLGAIAIAVALAFGIGGREVAARRLEKWIETPDKSES